MMDFEVNLMVVVAVSAVQLAFGVLAGFLLRGSRGTYDAEAAATAAAQARKYAEAMHRLHTLTGTIGADVGLHATHMADIGKGLADAQGDSEMHERLLAAVSKISEANDRLKGKLTNAEQKLREQASQLQEHMSEARTDALTGLSNRRAFDDEIKRRLAEFQRYKVPAALLLADIDHFKRFNDTHGHLAGDEVLKGVARLMQHAMREVDIVCRYGGEELAVVFPCIDVENVHIAAERAREAIEKAIFEFEGNKMHVTVSCGLTGLRPGDTEQSFIKRADEALYTSKKTGRNRCHVNDGRAMKLLTVASSAPVAPAPEVAQVAVEQVSIEVEVLQTVTETVELVKPTVAAEVETFVPAPGQTDPLTGLPNQQAFQTALRHRLAQRKQTEQPVSLILANVEGLEQFKRRHGRESSDMALKAVTQFFTAAVRDPEMVARYEFDRFAMLLPEADLARAAQAAERIRRAIELCKLRIDGVELGFRISAGAATALDDEAGAALIRRCAAALHASQQAGRNCVHLHDGESVVPAQGAEAVV